MTVTKKKPITQFNPERRRFVTKAGGVITLSVLPETLLAASSFSSLKDLSSDFENIVVLYSANNRTSLTFAKTLASYGVTILELAEDPFYTWRNGLSQLMESNKNYRLIGLTGWSEYLLLKGLNAELRRYPLREQGHWIESSNVEQWGVEQARRIGKLDLKQDMLIDDRLFLEPTNRKKRHGYDSLYSWVIG